MDPRTRDIQITIGEGTTQTTCMAHGSASPVPRREQESSFIFAYSSQERSLARLTRTDTRDGRKRAPTEHSSGSRKRSLMSVHPRKARMTTPGDRADGDHQACFRSSGGAHPLSQHLGITHTAKLAAQGSVQVSPGSAPQLHHEVDQAHPRCLQGRGTGRLRGKRRGACPAPRPSWHPLLPMIHVKEPCMRWSHRVCAAPSRSVAALK